MTSRAAGDFLQVNSTSVRNWVERGHLKGFRTPGGHLRVRAADLVSFMHSLQMPIPTELENIAYQRRLLVVDDDARYLKSLGRLLKPYAHLLEVRMENNGIDALLAVGTFRPDLVLLDISMPGIDGIEVCERLAQNAEIENIEVYILSGNLDDEVRRRAKAVGVKACFEKPTPVPEIVAAMGVVHE